MSGPCTVGARAPIAVFAYNRPDKLSAMMMSLQACNGFRDSPVTVFVDGPKRGADQRAVDDVRRIVQALATPNVSWIFREQNLGLRESVFTGVSQMVEQHGRVIVLEDDLVMSPIALDYFNSALRLYENADRVWSIAGYLYDALPLRAQVEAISLPFAHPWGWATWARAWRQFDLDSQPSSSTLASKSFQSAFDMHGMYPFTAQLRNSIEGRINSWFIHWYYTVFQHGGVSVFPPRRVLDNFGFRDGAHGGSLNPHERLVRRPPLLHRVPEFDLSADVDYCALDALRTCRELRVQRFIARAGSARRSFTSSR